MNGLINHFRRSKRRPSATHMIVTVDDVDSREKAEKLVGKEIIYNTGTKDIAGKVAAPHGRKGAVRVIFEKGMPGQAIGKKVIIK